MVSTSQQQLDTLGPLQGQGLVHMNGRVYDPTLGRFISADPRVQNAYNSQDLNRFAYVDNNPLNSSDPTGYDDSPNNDGSPQPAPTPSPVNIDFSLPAGGGG
jgi:RHS repeat-associated protein